jgi:hypothetical protein
MTAPAVGQSEHDKEITPPAIRVPIRPQPMYPNGVDCPDKFDKDRISLVIDERWRPQDEAYLGYSRTVEEHIRFLSGRHWDVWSSIQGKFIDALMYMTENERRWRHRPAMDYLAYWFALTLAKLSENPPVVGFLPANGDRESAMLAELMDTVWKIVFEQSEMDDTNMKALGWCLVAGQSYVMSYVDPEAGEDVEEIGPAMLSLDRADGTKIEREVDAVPFDEEGNPLAELREADGEIYYDVTGDPYTHKEGQIKTAALCPLEIRAEWGQNISWNNKRWIIHKWFKPTSEIQKRYGKTVRPNAALDVDSGPGYLERMMHGSGYFGAARNDSLLVGEGNAKVSVELVSGYTMWERPDGDLMPNGRLLVVTDTEVLWDSERPAAFDAAGPIRKIGFIPIPGRPFDSTPLERMIPIQKRLNRLEAQIAEHTDRCTNPILMVHNSAGIDGDDFVATPGMTIEHGYVGTGQPAYWLAPPPLGSDVWKSKEELRSQLFIIGGMAGADGTPPTSDPSGDLIEQLRYNSDRTTSPIIRSLVMMNADVAKDWIALIPTIWSDEKVIHYAGDDNVIRTLTVLPELFEDGQVVVKPVIESATPETRAARQQRVLQLYEIGAFGMPGSSQSIGKLLELSKFPDLGRASRPGGHHRILAERNLGKIAQGVKAADIPLLMVYDFETHIAVTEDHLSTPEYLDYTPEVQNEMWLHFEALQGAAVAKQIQKSHQIAALAGVQAAQMGAVQHAAIMSQPAGAPAGENGAEGSPAAEGAGASTEAVAA